MSWYQLLDLQTSFIYDLPNFFLCVLFLLIYYHVKGIPDDIFLLLVLHCLTPFFLNDVLFNASYLGDQFRYTGAVREIRDSFELISDSGNVARASWILAFVPIPFIETVSSLGFANKLIFISTYLYLLNARAFTRFTSYFILLYPSVIFYTSLSLRDTIIFCCMLLSVHFFFKKRLMLAFVYLAPLAFIKFQNFFLMTPYILFSITRVGTKGVSNRNAFIIFSVSLTMLILSFPVAQPMLNNLRGAMFREDGGGPDEIIPMINGFSDFIYLSLTSAPYFFIKPLPWEVSGAFQLIQSLENLFIMLMVFRLTVKCWCVDSSRIIFWILTFIFSMSIYGLVVFNYGTAARYRFPFIVIYIVFVARCFDVEKLFKIRIDR